MRFSTAKIFLIGMMGSGKSYWGRQLSQHWNYPFFDLDKQIEAEQGKKVADIFYKYGEELFRMTEKKMLHQLNEAHSRFIMSCGGGTPCFFDNMQWMKKQGIVVWLHPPLKIVAERLLTSRQKRPLLQNCHSLGEISAAISSQMAARMPFYSQAHFEMNESSPTIETFENFLCTKDY